MKRDLLAIVLMLAALGAVVGYMLFSSPADAASYARNYVRLTGGTDDGFNFRGDTTTRKKIAAVFFDDQSGANDATTTVMTFEGVEVYAFSLGDDKRDCFCPPQPVVVRNFVMTNLQTGVDATIVLSD